MWLALGVSFAIYFGGIFVLNFATQSYDNIPGMGVGILRHWLGAHR